MGNWRIGQLACLSILKMQTRISEEIQLLKGCNSADFYHPPTFCCRHISQPSKRTAVRTLKFDLCDQKFLFSIHIISQSTSQYVNMVVGCYIIINPVLSINSIVLSCVSWTGVFVCWIPVRRMVKFLCLRYS